MDKSKHFNPAMTDTRQWKNNPVERLVVIGSGGCGFRLGGDGLGARPRGCGMNGGRRWIGLEPSVGEKADDEEGDREEDEVSAAAGGAVLGSEAEIREANSSEGKVGIAAALLVIAATMLPAAASGDRDVAASASASTGGAGGGEADQCVSRCVGEMQACEAEAASRCAATTLSRRGGPCGGGGGGGGGGCENEYLGCIDIC
uniref:Uncharacterized protein n=1 Tax=Oryza meridionalis TaxID=40149 RepID=A0A0E0ERH6_9ORYZ